jgi:hypothetical protein
LTHAARVLGELRKMLSAIVHPQNAAFRLPPVLQSYLFSLPMPVSFSSRLSGTRFHAPFGNARPALQWSGTAGIIGSEFMARITASVIMLAPYVLFQL